MPQLQLVLTEDSGIDWKESGRISPSEWVGVALGTNGITACFIQTSFVYGDTVSNLCLA